MPTRKARGGPLGGRSRECLETLCSAVLWITLLDVITGKKDDFVDKPVGKPVENPVDKLVDNFFGACAFWGNCTT